MEWYYILAIGLGIILFLAISFWIYIKFIFAPKKGSQVHFSKKYSVDLNKLITDIGGIENIDKVEYTLSRLKLSLKQTKTINIEEVKRNKNINGAIFNESSITLIVNDQAQAIATAISDKLISN